MTHHHNPKSFSTAFKIAILVNSLFVVLQLSFAYQTNSTSLLADGFHNLGDVLSLVLAYVATILMKKAPSATTSFGLKKISILAALINGALLIFTCGIIATEATYKLFTPEVIDLTWVIIIASLGIIINGLTSLLFIKGAHEDLNIKAAFLHLFYDALISAGVVVAAIFMYFTNYLWLDPLLAILIAIIMVKGTWQLFKDSFLLIIDGVPSNISLNEVKDMLLREQLVSHVHDLHVWALSTKENAMSAHIVMPAAIDHDLERKRLIKKLKKLYPLHHLTLQIEKLGCDEQSCY